MVVEAATTKGGSTTTTRKTVSVWHDRGGWKRMELISTGYKWIKLKYLGKNRFLKLPKTTNRIKEN